jgi:hypothetical protein
MAKASLSRVNQAGKKCCGDHVTTTRPHPFWAKRFDWLDMIAAFVLGVAVVVGLGIGSAQAAEPTQEQISMTYALTWGLVADDLGLSPKWENGKLVRTGRRMAEITPPTVRVVPADKMCAEAKQLPSCVLKAFQLEDEIVVSDEVDWASAEQVTILLHEYVHFFQWVVGGQPTFDQCAEVRDRELYAYKVQSNVLARLPTWGRNRADEWYEDIRVMLEQDYVVCQVVRNRPYPPGSK